MKISRNWLNNYIVSKKSNNQLVDSFTQLGLECTAVQTKLDFKNVIVGKIIECIKHPNADKLKVCKVIIGKDKTLNIVCGAPNVRENTTVPVALVGALVGEIKIKKTRIRDILSNGMICSGKELSINDDNDGIMILNNDLKIGQPLETALSLIDDVIFDFDMTPNRGDCFSHLGIARELSIIENKKIKLKSPVLKHSKFKTSDLINVEIKNNDICKRYACRIIKNITIKESPQWLVNKLYSIGQKSINNVVDLANYIMFDLGQPLHVFDYDKLKGNRIEVRLAKKQEKILCLNNELKILSKNDIIIADSKGPVAIAGVIGGLNSHVNIETSNILLESAVFNEINIRRTAKKYEYAKEASKRFERGVDSNNVINVMDEFSRLLIDIAGGEISSDLIDIKKKDFKLKKIKFNPQVCNNFLGTKLDKNEFKKIFFKLSIDITINKNNFICVVPSYRNDIEREVDLFEEVARVYGYDNIPSKNKFIVSSQSFVKDQLDVEDKIRNILSNNGFNEHYSNSLYNKNDVKFFNHIFGEAIEIKNPLSNDMKFLRNSLIPGILRALSFNEKREQDHIKFYEIGSISKISNKTHSNSQERRELNIAYLGSKEYSWKNKQNFDIFDVKGDINMLCNNLGLYNIKYEEGNEGIISIIINNKNIGFVSYLNTNYKKYYDIYRDVIIANLRIDSLIALCENNSFIFKKISPYPTVTRDIAILIDISIKNEEIINIIKKSTSNILSSIKLFDIYQDKYLGKNTKSLAYSLKFQSLDRTLKINEVDKEIQLVLDNLKSKLNAKQR